MSRTVGIGGAIVATLALLTVGCGAKGERAGSGGNASDTHPPVAAQTPAQVTPPNRTVSAPDGGAGVVERHLCKSVANREPVGMLGEPPYAFPTGTDEVTYWLRTSVAASGTYAVVWERDGLTQLSTPLALTAGPFRTWASKSVQPGHWVVQFQDTDGHVLASDAFVVE